jgi:hypothetical protein
MGERTITRDQGDNPKTDLDRPAASWVWHLKNGKSPATIRAYSYAVAGLRDFLVSAGLPTDPRQITTAHIDAYLGAEIDKNSPAMEQWKAAKA